MSDIKRFFITSSNLKKLVFKSEIEIEQLIENVYQEIYDSDLSPYLSHREAKTLRKTIMFLEQADDQLLAMERKTRETQKKQRSFNTPSRFIFVSGPPKYHQDDSCETLSKDFDNFEVPEEIRNRSDEEIRRFREFAQLNRKLLKEGREDVFLMRLKNEFHLRAPLDRVSLPNSGHTTIPEADAALDIKDITSKIQVVIKELIELGNTEEGKAAIKAYMYASIRILYDNKNLKDVEKKLLTSKKDLIDLVLRYHVKLHRGDVAFSAELLSIYGFEPCATCCVPKISF